MAEDYVRKDTFEDYKVSIDRRFGEHSKRLDGLHHGPGGMHELRNAVSPVPMLVQRVEGIVNDLKHLPRQADLDSQTVILTNKIDASEKTRADLDRQKWRHIQLMFTILGGIATILGIVSLLLTLAQRHGKG